MTKGAGPQVWGEPLLHPFCLVSMAVWWLNDHVGKVYVPSSLTGKASDVAGLVVFPLWTWCLVDGLASNAMPKRYARNATARVWCLYGVTAAVCAWFALINVSDVIGAVHRELWTSIYRVIHRGALLVGGYWSSAAHHTVDPADVFALPAALVGVWVGRDSIASAGARGAGSVANKTTSR